MDDRIFQYCQQIARLLSFVDANLDRPICLRELAEAVGVAPTTLSHLFRAKTGLRLFDWLARYRIEKAKAFLLEADHPIWEVASKVGMEERAFRRAFKRCTGTCPREYRHQHAPTNGATSAVNLVFLTDCFEVPISAPDVDRDFESKKRPNLDRQ